jgi:hypothetical protein
LLQQRGLLEEVFAGYGELGPVVEDLAGLWVCVLALGYGWMGGFWWESCAYLRAGTSLELGLDVPGQIGLAVLS